MANSALMSSLMNVVIRVAAASLHSFEIAFFRNLFGVVALVPSVLRQGIGKTLRTERPGLHLLRGLLNAGAMLSFFFALTITPLATVAALGFTAPLFATLLAVPVLKERVGPRRWIGLLVGFFGTLIVVRPSGDMLAHPGSLLVLLSALLWAGALVAIKILSRTDSSLTTTFFAACILTPITLAFALLHWRWPDPTLLAILMVIAALGTLTQISLAQAFREADASLVLPLDFTKLIWASLFGLLLFDETPDLPSILGGLLIVGAVSFVAIEERRATRRGFVAASRSTQASAADR